MQAGIFTAEFRDACRDRQGAALRHGVAGIDGQVEDHLLHLPAIGYGGARLRCRGGAQLNAAPMLVHTRSRRPVMIALRSSISGWVSSWRAKMSSCLVSRAARCAAIRICSASCRTSGRAADASATKRRIHDDRQQVIEVMGDTGRQLPQGVKPFRLVQFHTSSCRSASIRLPPVTFRATVDASTTAPDESLTGEIHTDTSMMLPS